MIETVQPAIASPLVDILQELRSSAPTSDSLGDTLAAQRLFQGFLFTPESYFIQQKVRNFVPTTDEPLDKFCNSVAGWALERIALPWVIQQDLNLGTKIFGSDQTFEVFRRRNPETAVKIFFGLNGAIEDTVHPDLLGIRLGRGIHMINTMYEIKASYNLGSREKRQLTNLLDPEAMADNLNIYRCLDGLTFPSAKLGQEVHKIDPEIPDYPTTLAENPELVYVVTRLSRINPPGIRKIELPFTGTNYNRFLNHNIFNQLAV